MKVVVLTQMTPDTHSGQERFFGPLEKQQHRARHQTLMTAEKTAGTQGHSGSSGQSGATPRSQEEWRAHWGGAPATKEEERALRGCSYPGRCPRVSEGTGTMQREVPAPGEGVAPAGGPDFPSTRTAFTFLRCDGADVEAGL